MAMRAAKRFCGGWFVSRSLKWTGVFSRKCHGILAVADKCIGMFSSARLAATARTPGLAAWFVSPHDMAVCRPQTDAHTFR